MTDCKKELQRVFEFVVKHNSGNIPWENKITKKLIKWSLFYKKIFIVYDGPRIAALAFAWRTSHPENSYEDLSLDKTESGDYMHVFRVIIHPEYRKEGYMFQLFVMGLIRFRGVKTVFWEKRTKNGKSRMVIVPVEKLLEELYKWQKKTRPHSLLKSK
jgi:hypothetical protein